MQHYVPQYSASTIAATTRLSQNCYASITVDVIDRFDWQTDPESSIQAFHLPSTLMNDWVKQFPGWGPAVISSSWCLTWLIRAPFETCFELRRRQHSLNVSACYVCFHRGKY